MSSVRANPALIDAVRAASALHRRACANFWLSIFFLISRRAPWLLRVIKYPALWITWQFSRSIRAATLNNSRWLLGPTATTAERTRLSKAILAGCFDSVAELGINQHRTTEQIRARLKSVEGQDLYRSARQSGLGAILVTAHIGSFETAIAMLAEREKKIHVVYQRDPFPVFDRLRSLQHQRLGVNEAPVNEGLTTWFSLRDALLRDEVVLIQADRVMPGQRGVLVPFMGGHIEIPSGPVRLAEATGSPIIPVFALHLPDNGVHIQIDEPIWIPQSSSSTSWTHDALLRIAAAIERIVRTHPDQWLCLHSAWREDSSRGPATHT